MKFRRAISPSYIPRTCRDEFRLAFALSPEGYRNHYEQDLLVHHDLFNKTTEPLGINLAPSNGRPRADSTHLKYCYNCDRVTIGDPAFCNFCGRSYDVKLCPRLHVNPRGAFACSKCGSHELTTPQPRVPSWTKIVLFFLTLIPGILLSIFSIGLVLFFIHRFLFSPDMLMGLAGIDFILGTLWWGWSEIPLYYRKSIHRWLQRHGKADRDR